MTNKEFYIQWNEAKKLNTDNEFEKSIKIYQLLVPELENIENIIPKQDDVSDEYYTKQIHFEKAMFWGDYSAPLCNDGQFELALNISDKALYHKEKGEFSTMLYIIFNRANISLFSKKYQEAIFWYDKAIFENESNGIWLNENEKASYYNNKAEALYFLKCYDEAEKWFLKSINAVDNNKDFEPFYFLSEIYKLKGDNKSSQKFQKMFLTRKNKLTEKVFNQRIRFYNIQNL
ncbi:hypothetical protein [Flavobacterium sp.]|uniref:hypothetical protein n=1 Tax=Flavobacterium sp. TaxID=239 RepID=UPI0031CDEFF7